MAYRKSWIRGRKCTRRQKVRVKGQGMRFRCVSFGPKRSGGGYRKRGSKRYAGGLYRKGRRPYNKGKSCVDYGVNKRGVRTCRSYGKVYGPGMKNRRKSRIYGPQAASSAYSWGAHQNAQRRAVEAREAGLYEPGSWYGSQFRRMMAL
jgi:hypothetical protein